MRGWERRAEGLRDTEAGAEVHGFWQGKTWALTQLQMVEGGLEKRQKIVTLRKKIFFKDILLELENFFHCCLRLLKAKACILATIPTEEGYFATPAMWRGGRDSVHRNHQGPSGIERRRFGLA